MTSAQSSPKTAKEAYVAMLLDEIGPILSKAEEVTVAMSMAQVNVEASLEGYKQLLASLEITIKKSVDQVAHIVDAPLKAKEREFYKQFKVLLLTVLASSVISSVCTAGFFYLVYENKIKSSQNFNSEALKKEIMRYIEPAAIKRNY